MTFPASSLRASLLPRSTALTHATLVAGGTLSLAGLVLATFAMYLLAGITGATGGYLVGMMVATVLIGVLANRQLDQKFLCLR